MNRFNSMPFSFEARKRLRPSSPYRVVIKIDHTGYRKSEDFMKLSGVRDLVKLSQWLDVNRPNWKYMNVYYKKTNEQIASFTQHNRPHSKKVVGYP